MKSQPKITTLGKGDMFTEVSGDDTEEIVKLDLVGTDHCWEEWSIKERIENLQKWLVWNKTHDLSTDTGDSCKRERHWYKRDTSREYKAPSCLYCQGDQWLEACEVKDEISFTKRNCVATAGGGSWREHRITAKSSLLQVQVETPNELKWQTFNKRIESRIGVHYMQPWLRRSNITSHHSAEDSRDCGLTFTRTLGGISYQEKQLRSWSTWLQNHQDGARQLLRLDLHLCHLKSVAPGINETTTLSFEKLDMVIVDTKSKWITFPWYTSKVTEGSNKRWPQMSWCGDRMQKRWRK